MRVAQRLDPFVHGTSLTFVALLPATLAARRQARVAELLGDWDPADALAALQRPQIGA